MALTDTHAVSHGNSFLGFFAAIGRGLIAMAEANPRMKKLERLSAMTDDELKSIGVKREDIVRHALGDLLYL